MFVDFGCPRGYPPTRFIEDLAIRSTFLAYHMCWICKCVTCVCVLLFLAFTPLAILLVKTVENETNSNQIYYFLLFFILSLNCA